MNRYDIDTTTATSRGRIVYDRPRRTWSLWLAGGGALLAGVALWPDDPGGPAAPAATPGSVAAVAAETPSIRASAAAVTAPMSVAESVLTSGRLRAPDDEVVVGLAGNDPFGARAWSGNGATPQAVQADEEARADAELEAARAQVAPHIAGEGVLGSPVVSLGIAAETVPPEVAANLSRVPQRGESPDVGVLATLR